MPSNIPDQGNSMNKIIIGSDAVVFNPINLSVFLASLGKYGHVKGATLFACHKLGIFTEWLKKNRMADLVKQRAEKAHFLPGAQQALEYLTRHGFVISATDDIVTRKLEKQFGNKVLGLSELDKQNFAHKEGQGLPPPATYFIDTNTVKLHGRQDQIPVLLAPTKTEQDMAGVFFDFLAFRDLKEFQKFVEKGWHKCDPKNQNER